MRTVVHSCTGLLWAAAAELLSLLALGGPIGWVVVSTGCSAADSASSSSPATGGAGAVGGDTPGTGGVQGIGGATGGLQGTAGATGGTQGVGGTNAGGANTGGTNTGGANTGGTNTGGANTGGANTGGANTGGANTGGTNTGGTNTGGTSTGGTNTGGTNTGGTNTGGTNTGGANTGGSSGSNADWQGDYTITMFGKEDCPQYGREDGFSVDSGTCVQRNVVQLDGDSRSYFGAPGDLSTIWEGAQCVAQGSGYPSCNDQQNCGKCYEIKCDPNGTYTFPGDSDTHGAYCRTDQTVVIKAVDACPHNHPNNTYWCTSQRPNHIDISCSAFRAITKDRDIGQIGSENAQLRPVDCSVGLGPHPAN